MDHQALQHVAEIAIAAGKILVWPVALLVVIKCYLYFRSTENESRRRI